MKKLALGFILTLAAAVAIAAVTHSASWTAPTTNTDGSAITVPLTYNVYQGQKGAETLLASGLTALTAPVDGPCVYVTATEGTTEGVPSNEVCLLIPGAPKLTAK